MGDPEGPKMFKCGMWAAQLVLPNIKKLMVIFKKIAALQGP